MCVSVAMVRCVRGTTGVCVCAGWEEDVCVHGVGRVCMQGCEEGVCVCRDDLHVERGAHEDELEVRTAKGVRVSE